MKSKTENSSLVAAGMSSVPKLLLIPCGPVQETGSELGSLARKLAFALADQEVRTSFMGNQERGLRSRYLIALNECHSSQDI